METIGQVIDSFTSFAVETANGDRNSICQLSFVKVVSGVISERHTFLIQPPFNDYSEDNIREHGITPEMTMHAPQFPTIWRKIQTYFINQTIVAYCTELDIDALSQALEAYAIQPPHFNFSCIFNYYHCPMEEACRQNNIHLEPLSKLSEAEAAARLFLLNQGVHTHDARAMRPKQL